MVSQVGYLVAGQSRGRVVLCVVYTVHVEMRSAGFLVEPQNQGRRFVSGLASNPLGRFLIGLGLKTDDNGLSVVCPQNHWDGFLTVWLQNLLRRFLAVWPQNVMRRFLAVWPQNVMRRFLPVWPQNRWWVSCLSLKTKVVEGFLV
jgi:hypothetical protein